MLFNQRKLRYDRLLLIVYAVMILVHLYLRTHGRLVFPFTRSSHLPIGVNLIPFAGLEAFIMQQGAFKLAGKILWYVGYAVIIYAYVKPFMLRNRLFIAGSLFTIVFEEVLNRLCNGGAVIIDMNNIVLYICGLALGYIVARLGAYLLSRIKHA